MRCVSVQKLIANVLVFLDDVEIIFVISDGGEGVCGGWRVLIFLGLKFKVKDLHEKFLLWKGEFSDSNLKTAYHPHQSGVKSGFLCKKISLVS